MRRKLYLATLTAAALAAGSLIAPPASANNVGWSVSVGVPGVAVTAGAPYYYGYPYRVYGPAYYGPYHRHYYRPYRAYAPAVVYPAPVVTYPPVVTYAPPPYRVYRYPY